MSKKYKVEVTRTYLNSKKNEELEYPVINGTLIAESLEYPRVDDDIDRLVKTSRQKSKQSAYSLVIKITEMNTVLSLIDKP